MKMPRKVCCSESVVQQLSTLEKNERAAGLLIGFASDDELTVIGCIRCLSNNVLADLESIDTFLPGGIFIVGFFHQKGRDLLKKLSTQLSQLLILSLTDEGKDVLHPDNLSYWTAEDGKTSVILETMNDKFVNSCIVARNKCTLDINIDVGQKDDTWKKSLDKEVEKQCNNIRSSCTLYKLDQSNVLIGGKHSCGTSCDSKCTVLYDLIEEDDDGFTKVRKKREKTQEILNFTTFMKRSGTTFDNIPPCAPVIFHNIVNTKMMTITLQIDCLATVTQDTRVSALAVALSTAICRQLKAMRNCILQHSQKEDFQAPKSCHFRPDQLDTFVSVVYPANTADDKLEETRNQIHKMFCVKEDRPVFRRNNRHMFPDDIAQYGYLINPHTGLSSSGVKEGKVYLVKGVYSYHHYMQDRFNDDKWGCAYRSLQTLVSWFKLQGYTDKAIPGHKDIQQALVDVGDKDPTFVGSKQWIGSMEVSYVLDHLIGVTSKILFVSSGADLPSKGRELAQHFDSQGTPIMIGGGVLAHTILGVDFDDVTGDLKFLILDPHYTGAEDLKVILDKGWCGWKGPDFWDQTAHYNMCMPQRPICI